MTSENFVVVEMILSSAVCKNPGSNTYYVKTKRTSEGCVLIIAEDELYAWNLSKVNNSFENNFNEHVSRELVN